MSYNQQDYFLYPIPATGMLKLLKYCLQWIQQHKMLASVLFLAWVLALGLLITDQGIWISQVFAQWPEDKQSLADTVSFLDVLLKVIYLILRPFIFLSGVALDNSLVLGEVFNLDSVLRKFRRIMTTFANFGLALVVLYKIIEFIVTKKENKEVFDIIGKSLLAWVLIQASWFIILALIDLSTIAIYSIWAMPMNFIGDTQVGQKIVLEMDGKMDLSKFKDDTVENRDDSDQAFIVTYKCNGDMFRDDKKLLACHIKDGFIIWPVTIPKVTSIEKDDIHYCHINNGNFANSWVVMVGITPATSANTALTGRVDCIATFDLPTADADLQRIKIPPECKTPVTKSYKNSAVYVNNDELLGNSRQCQKLGDVLSKSKWFVKVMATMYSSLLNFANINLSESTLTAGSAVSVFMLKLILALALFIPLLALTIVLLVRVAYLWMIIVFSPLLVIKNVFKFDKFKIIWWIKIRGSELWEGRGDILGVIFMPVTVVFALSMWLIFLSVLQDKFNPLTTDQKELEAAFDVKVETDQDYTSFTFNRTSSTEIENPKESYGMSIFLNFFGYIFVNLFAIGVMRMVFFAAMKTSKTLGNIGDKINKKGTEMLWSLPIIPLPWGWKAGVGSVFGTGYDSLAGTVTSEVLNKNKRTSGEWINAFLGNAPRKDLTDIEKSNAAAQVLKDGSLAWIQEYLRGTMGKEYQDDGNNSYRNQVVEELIKNTEKAKLIPLIKKELTGTKTEDEVKSILTTWKNLKFNTTESLAVLKAEAAFWSDLKFTDANNKVYTLKLIKDWIMALEWFDPNETTKEEQVTLGDKEDATIKAFLDQDTTDTANAVKDFNQIAKEKTTKDWDYLTPEIVKKIAEKMTDDNWKKKTWVLVLKDIETSKDKKRFDTWVANNDIKKVLITALEADSNSQGYKALWENWIVVANDKDVVYLNEFKSWRDNIVKDKRYRWKDIKDNKTMRDEAIKTFIGNKEQEQALDEFIKENPIIIMSGTDWS